MRFLFMTFFLKVHRSFVVIYFVLNLGWPSGQWRQTVNLKHFKCFVGSNPTLFSYFFFIFFFKFYYIKNKWNVMVSVEVNKKLSTVLPCSVSLIELTFEQLVLVDFHVGSKINNFEKLNYHFVFGKRHKNFVVNLQFTLFNLRSCLFFLTNLVSRRGKVLFLDCAPSNRNLIAFFAKTSRQYFSNHKWISGTLTNFKYFYPAVFEGASQHFNLSGKGSFGFRFLHRIPNVVCFLDVSANIPAVTEVIRLGIPSISIVNTGLPIAGITFPIFANSFSIDSFTILLSLLRSSILNGYRFEIYKFFRDSVKRILKKRLCLSVYGKSYLDSFFFLLKFTLSNLFFSFFFFAC